MFFNILSLILDCVLLTLVITMHKIIKQLIKLEDEGK